MTRYPQIFCIGALAVFLAATDANACRGWIFEWQIIFDEVPFGLDAPVIAQVTVLEALPANNLSPSVVLARVDKIVKGKLDGDTVRLTYMNSSCGPGYAQQMVGKSGIVLGQFELNGERASDLHLIHDSHYALQKRKEEKAAVK